MPRLLRLYPAAWRVRYGEEFADLLASRPASLRDQIDILAGAIDARLHPQVGTESPADAAIPRDRSLGALMVLAGALITAWAGLGSLQVPGWKSGDVNASPELEAAAWLFGMLGAILVAVALLAIASRYDWAIGSAGVVGAVLTAAGLAFTSVGGGAAALLLLGGGTVLFAWRARATIVGTLAALLLVVATMLMIGAFVAVAANSWTDMTPFYLVVCYGPAWMLFGRDLRAPARQTQLAGAAWK